MTENQFSGVSMCQLSLPGFEGSADTLLALVADRKLPANDVPVADVTRQFLVHMTQGNELNLLLAGDLMAASARLMVLKSSQLLLRPEPEEGDESVEEQAFDPAERRRFAVVAGVLSDREGKESFLPFSSPVEIERRFEPRSPHLMIRAWHELSGRSTAADRRVSVPGFVRLEVAVSGLIRTLRSRSTVRFRHLIRGRSRNDAVMHFMAMLELVRQKRVTTEQDELFGDITLHWEADNAESSTRVG